MPHVEITTIMKSKISDLVDFLPSTVAGYGLFAKEVLEENTFIHVTHVHRDLVDRNDCENTWINLEPNYLYNHSKKHKNCESVTDGLTKGLFTIKRIPKGEELLADYTKDKELEQPQSGWAE